MEKNKTVFEVWTLGYNKDYEATNFEYFIEGGYTDVKEARKCFGYFTSKHTLIAYLENKNVSIPADTEHIHLFLEECAEVDDGNGGKTTECQDVVEEIKIF